MASHLLRASLRAISRPALRYGATPAAMPRLGAVAKPMIRPMGCQYVRFMSAGSVDSDLAHKLSEEHTFEKSNEEAGEPAFVKEFLERNAFQIEDKPGHDEVSLTRSFGNEKIRVLFSIADINNASPDEGFFQEESAEATVEEEDSELPPAFPVRASVTVEKADKGSVVIDTVAQDGDIMIESVMFYKDGKLATEQSAEADWQRRGLYIGPQFDELDEGLQQLFAQYLEERGVDTALASFLPDYVEYKEQKEYIRWLENVKDFVSA